MRKIAIMCMGINVIRYIRDVFKRGAVPENIEIFYGLNSLYLWTARSRSC